MNPAFIALLYLLYFGAKQTIQTTRALPETFLPAVTVTGRSHDISKHSSSVSKGKSRSKGNSISKDIESSKESDSDRGILSELSQHSRGDHQLRTGPN